MTRAAILVFLALASAASAGEILTDDVDLTGVQVAFLGEVHDNPRHHAAQAWWVGRMQPSALVFEMLSPGQALRVGENRDDAQALGEALQWGDSGWPDFALYYPIFTAAPDAAVFGGAVSSGAARAAVREGAAAVMGASAPLFGLDQPLPDGQRDARIAGQADAHCGALPEELLPGMVEAQRLRDAALARAVIAALAETGGPVAVITGNGHARLDWGAPATLAMARPELEILSVGQLEAPEDGAPYDVWTVSKAPERGDPCDGLR